MKKIIAAILIILMLFSLCACGISRVEPNVTNDFHTTTDDEDLIEEVLDTGAVDGPVDIDLPVVDDSGSLESSGGYPARSPAYANAAYTLTDYVVVDNEICTYIIKDVDPSGYWGFVLNVICENKTAKPLKFIFDDACAMGFMVGGGATDVDSGEIVNDTVFFGYNDLNEIGMESIDEITFTLQYSDTDIWSNDDPILIGEYTIYPTEKDIQDISYPARMVTDTEVVLYDTDDYCAIILSNETDDRGFHMNFYLENKTDHEIIFTMTWGNVFVNGYLVDPRWGMAVSAGKKMYNSLCFDYDLLDEHGISSVEVIEFTLSVLNADSKDVHATNVFTYIP